MHRPYAPCPACTWSGSWGEARLEYQLTSEEKLVLAATSTCPGCGAEFTEGVAVKADVLGPGAGEHPALTELEAQRLRGDAILLERAARVLDRTPHVPHWDGVRDILRETAQRLRNEAETSA